MYFRRSIGFIILEWVKYYATITENFLGVISQKILESLMLDI